MFHELIKKLKCLDDIDQIFKTQEDCLEFLEDLMWAGYPESPFDCTSKVYKCSNHRYKCKNTGKYFTVLTGTIFANTKLPLKTWFKVIFLLITSRNGISSVELTKRVRISQPSAWFMLQKIRIAMGQENNHKLDGVVEVDEYYAGGIFKNMHYGKKQEAKAKGKFQNKTPVQGMVERDGNAVAFVVPNFEEKTLNTKVLKYVKPSAILYSDENPSYNKLNGYYHHDNVTHSKGNYVNENVHTNTIESVWATLTRTINTYIHVSKKYLQYYINECIFRYNTRRLTIKDAFVWALKNTSYMHKQNGYINT